ncbi:ParB/RepB/Spo0J family partition protein [Candidatus Kuenenbacteria bacterium]|nr:ParB/RepB/Spo0J family partition protein [Candidatus Kuenenbacteria bacterium]
MQHLGRGLGALIPNQNIPSQNNLTKEKDRSQLIPASDYFNLSQIKNNEKNFEIPIEKIKTNPEQPRQIFNHEAMEELINSILEHGILQPLIVCKDEEQGFYQLIAGERRLRAARIAGLKTAPVIIREAKASKKLQLALVENIQRQNLNPIEEGKAYQRLIDKFNLTQEEVAKKIGKNRATIANVLRILSLPEKIQEALISGKINLGHAKIILSFNNPKEQLKLFKKILRYELNVRETENIKKRNGQIKKNLELDSNLKEKEENLRDILGTKVKILPKEKGGQIIIEYYSDEELGKIVKKIIK